MAPLFIVSLALVLSSCTTIHQAGSAYFKMTKPMAGVETYTEVLERMEHHQEMRRMLYHSFSEERLLECTVLRNQMYVAALNRAHGKEGEEMEKLAIMLEEAYQQNDESFMRACEQVKNSSVGKDFARIAYRYLPWDKKEYKNVR